MILIELIISYSKNILSGVLGSLTTTDLGLKVNIIWKVDVRIRNIYCNWIEKRNNWIHRKTV